VKTVAEMAQEDLAAFVQTHLRAKGIDAVLTGGAVVALYSDGRYTSADINLVDQGFSSAHKIKQAMMEIGFSKSGHLYGHPETDYFIDFLAPPLSVGREPVKEIHDLRLATGMLRLLSPTDCVKDRLASYYFFNDLQAFEQALLVTQVRSVDLAEVQRWSEAGGMSEKFEEFLSEMNQ